jgi:hypothetical protein
VKNRFQNVPFTFNLCRYATGYYHQKLRRIKLLTEYCLETITVGLYKLNSVARSLRAPWFQPLSLSSEKPVSTFAPWFQPLSLSSEKPVSTFAFKSIVCRYITEELKSPGWGPGAGEAGFQRLLPLRRAMSVGLYKLNAVDLILNLKKSAWFQMATLDEPRE